MRAQSDFRRKCNVCGKWKGPSGYYRRNSGLAHTCIVCSSARAAKWQKENRERRLLSMTKCRAKRLGVPFSLALSDLRPPKRCPICRALLERRSGPKRDTSPSIDRIIPARGYVKENVIIICMACNRRKQDSTPEMLSAIVEWLYRVREERGLVG